MTVTNSGNSSVPPPPIREPEWWKAAWNTFTGVLSAAWNAVVAVATFIANVALAVVKWCIDFAVAIANGEGLEFFYNTVVKPFVDALLAFIKWIVDLVMAAFNAAIFGLIHLIEKGFEKIAFGLIRGINALRQGDSAEGSRLIEIALFQSGGSSLFDMIFWVTFGLTLGLQIVGILLTLFGIGLGLDAMEEVGADTLIISFGVLLGAFSLCIGEGFASLLRSDDAPNELENILETILGNAIVSFILAAVSVSVRTYLLSAICRSKSDPLRIALTAFNLAFGFIGLGLAAYFLVHPPPPELEKEAAAASGLMSLAGIICALSSLTGPKSPGSSLVRILPAIGLIIGGIGLSVAIAKLY